ncbi:site-specific integrase [Fructilactobacillus hinvesii]|uniref:Site-specific integrase n=1 Tax=Fructilactobacillus hinvesii TaxID=2940300 RepID=A0ABY5BS54_9LACO|nr:site-specific integrase [Fructilactobacillus hinvesii]USS87485.1 site-specific integrase [Fructilactobacillus hinvesii]
MKKSLKARKEQLFWEYFNDWIDDYKDGAVREVTLAKYRISAKHLRHILPDTEVGQLDRRKYQKLINMYAKDHEIQTVKDFHHQIKAAIFDAVDEGLIDVDPTRRIVLKGKRPRKKNIKYLNEFEVRKFLDQLTLGSEPSIDWLILLIAKTGLRFSEGLGVTPDDFDFQNMTLTINKTWDYKSFHGSFQPTKNQASIRTISIDWKLGMEMRDLVKNLPKDEPIFVPKDKRIFNSTYNAYMKQLCEKAGVNVITMHGLRHTHASLLILHDVSLSSVAERLGHSTVTTTQETYIHILKEQRDKDNSKMMSALTGLD